MLLLLFVAIGAAISPRCISESGVSVDWWMMLKAPIITSSSDPPARQGFAYVYLDAKSPTLKLMPGGLDTNKNGALWKTLDQIYGASASSHAWLMFNDAHPDGTTPGSTYAHQKGALLFDKTRGFYLIHSTPRFPANIKDGYDGFPTFAAKYAQSFMCTTLDYKTFNDVGSLLVMSRPSLYEQNLPSSFTGVDNIKGVISGVYNNTAASTIRKITTSGGTTFTAFAKTYKWGQDLYEGLVAPELKSNLLVETWMNGVNPLPTYCKPKYKYDVINVRELSVGGLDYKETQDHSKWAVSFTKSNVCIGGINRQTGQLSRGGGTWCLSNAEVWKSFNGTITSSDGCVGE